MKLLKVHNIVDAMEQMDLYFSAMKSTNEETDIENAEGRILAENIYSPIDLPEFNKSTVDGYAVKAASTVGASDTMPLFIKAAGEVEMGKPAMFAVDKDNCVYVPTGGMLPEGSDGVVMIEYVEKFDDSTIAIGASIAGGDGMIKAGDDFKKGQLILEKGQKISYREIAVLAACGKYKIPVVQKPKVGIISTGDEIVSREKEVTPGKVRDINSFALASMVKAAGGEAVHVSCMEDDFERLKDEVLLVSKKADIIVISGGSSAGIKDETANVINSLGEPGVFIHGVAVKPGKPTIMGASDGKAYFGLPGHPASAMIIFKVFVEPLIIRLLGEKVNRLHIKADIFANIPSAPGKETFVMVKLEKDPRTKSGYMATPLHGKSAAVGYIAKADGFIRIHENTEGLRKGDIIEVELF